MREEVIAMTAREAKRFYMVQQVLEWKVRLIEEDFHRLMFDAEDV